MPRPNIKILAPLQDAYQKADAKFLEVHRDIIHIQDSGERVATAKVLMDMLELEIKETKTRLDGLKRQRWQREGEEPVDPEVPNVAPDVDEPKARPYPPMPPGTPPAPEKRESIWADGKLPPTIGEDFRRLSGLRNIGEAKLPLLNVGKLVKDVAKKLGLPPEPKAEYGHMMAMVSTPTTRRGEVPAFTVTHDTSRQTGMEVLGFEIASDVYRQIKNLLPPHKLDTAKHKGRLMARPTERLGAN